MCTKSATDMLDQVRAGLAAMLGADPVAASDETVSSELRELLTITNLVQAAVWARLASFDVRGLSEQDGLRTTRSWLSAAGRLSPYAASRLLKRARVVRQLPALATATATGRITGQHAHKTSKLAGQIGIG